jgi:hypothetical protein
MNEPSPSTDVVAALDAPFLFARTRFAEYAPTIAACVFLGVLPGLPMVFLSAYVQGMAQTDPTATLKLLPLVYVGPCVGVVGITLGYAMEAACIANILAGRDAGLGEAFSRIASARFWLAYLLAFLLNGIGHAFCCFGGFLLVLPFGLMVPSILEEGLGAEAVNRSMQLSLQKTGPGFFDRPGWKAVAVVAVSLVVAMAFTQAASIPLYMSMGSRIYDAIRSGNVDAIQQGGMVDPWVSIVTQLLQACARVFTDTYGIAGMFLIFRDARARLGGADLDRLIEETPRG